MRALLGMRIKWPLRQGQNWKLTQLIPKPFLTHVKMVRRACLDIVQLQGGPGELCSWYVLRIAKV